MTKSVREEICHQTGTSSGVFFIERSGERVAELTYRISGRDAIIDYTYVARALRNTQVARQLVEAAVELGASRGSQVAATLLVRAQGIRAHAEFWRCAQNVTARS